MFLRLLDKVIFFFIIVSRISICLDEQGDFYLFDDKHIWT
jgi:hypothetical protein